MSESAQSRQVAAIPYRRWYGRTYDRIGLGFAGPVKSPTFSLVETYPVAGLTLNHFDFYRFEEPEEFEDAGFRDLFAWMYQSAFSGPGSGSSPPPAP